MPDPMGQHFLRPRAAKRVVDTAQLRVGMRVLDVGAGAGALTKEIVRKVGPTGHVVAVEIDAELAGRLKGLGPNVEVITGDALRVPLPKIEAVVANPPFRIAAPLIRRLIQLGVPMTLVVPEELAQRLTAREGTATFGRLTVQVAAWAEAAQSAGLSPFDFEPAPDVDAVILHLKPTGNRAPASLEIILEEAWNQLSLRRAINPIATKVGLSTEEVTAACDAAGVRDVEPAKIGTAQWLRVARQVDGAMARRRKK